MRNSKALYITKAAVIAALYVVLTLFINAFNLASGAIQVRVSEALTILPFFMPEAVPGLFVGCMLSNIITGCLPWDIVFGSIATLIGAVGTYYIGKIKSSGSVRFNKIKKWLAPLPPILSNTLIIPFVLIKVYSLEGIYPYFMLTVGIGEILSAGVLGMILLLAVEKRINTTTEPHQL